MSIHGMEEKILWDDENYLRKLIKEELQVRPNMGIELKRTQVIEGLLGSDLTFQLEMLGETVSKQTNKFKRLCLQKLVNHVKAEESYSSSVTSEPSVEELSVQDNLTSESSGTDSEDNFDFPVKLEKTTTPQKVASFIDHKSVVSVTPVEDTCWQSINDKKCSVQVDLYGTTKMYDSSIAAHLTELKKIRTAFGESVMTVVKKTPAVTVRRNIVPNFEKDFGNKEHISHTKKSKRKASSFPEKLEQKKRRINEMDIIAKTERKTNLSFSSGVSNLMNYIFIDITCLCFISLMLNHFHCPSFQNMFDVMDVKSFEVKDSKHLNDENYTLQVSVTKICDIHRDMDGKEPVVEHNIVVSFQILAKWQQPLWWIKMEKVAVMLRSLEHDQAPVFFFKVHDGFVRANPGSLSSVRKENSSGFPFKQIFVIAKWWDAENVNDIVHEMTEKMLNYLKCKHFFPLYMKMIESDNGKGIFNKIMPLKDKEVKKFSDMKTSILENLSLDSFLLDNDIRGLYHELYGKGNIKFNDLSLNEKQFFF